MDEINKHAKGLRLTKLQVIEMAVEIARLAMLQFCWARDENGEPVKGDRQDDPAPYKRPKKSLKIRNRGERKKDPKLFPV